MYIIKKYKLTIVLILSLIIISFASLFVGVYDISFTDLFNDPEKTKVFFISRLPRLLAILCTGMGMSVSGLIMQMLCRNKFVSPSTGATLQSAQLGILVSMVVIPVQTVLARTLFSFIFALIGTWLFVFIIQRTKFKNIIIVPLIGIMFGNIISGVTNFIAYKFEVTQSLSNYLSGDFSHILKGNYELVYIVLPLIILAFIFASYFNIVGMGENFSKNLGVNYNLILFIGLSLCAIITAAIVSVVGSISYIGLIIPNLIVIFKGDNLKGTIIDTALFGAIFVLVCDIVARLVIAPFELPVNLIISIVGTILFITFILLKLKYGNKSVSFKKRKDLVCKNEN